MWDFDDNNVKIKHMRHVMETYQNEDEKKCVR